jgi:hypothetical protein
MFDVEAKSYQEVNLHTCYLKHARCYHLQNWFNDGLTEVQTVATTELKLTVRFYARGRAL